MKVIFVICIFRYTIGNLLLEVNRSDKAILVVKNILVELNSQTSATHDVALLQLYVNEKQRVEDICRSLATAVPKENLVTTPNLLDKSKNRDMRRAAVIIMVSDVHDFVSLVCVLSKSEAVSKRYMCNFLKGFF